jgi:hypothetical protein
MISNSWCENNRKNYFLTKNPLLKKTKNENVQAEIVAKYDFKQEVKTHRNNSLRQ